MNEEAEQISSDHVYATGRDVKKILDRIEVLEAKVLEREKKNGKTK